MVIEHSEKFGLAQLHQLRGRVGRSDKKSSCILLYSDKIGENGKQRLKILRETDDGFKIAEEDLALRGIGDLIGVKQSGFPDFIFALLPEHKELLFAARDDVKIILHQDPHLKNERGTALKNLLYFYEYDKQIKLLTV
jgi:ATP-dependent DNA helicase RecG